MKFIISLTLLLCSTCISFSQSFSSHPIALTPTAFPVSNFDKEVCKERLYKKFANEPKSEGLDNYINRTAISIDAYLSSSVIYTNWTEAEEYVKKVFEKSIPKEFNPGDIKIYVVRDPSPNAYCMEDGNIAVTVGFLSYMQTEAELASVLCHEFGHYFANHNFEEFKKRNRNKFFRNTARSSVLASLMYAKNLSEFNQNQERQADTFCNNFFTRNGYEPTEIAGAFIHFKSLTDKNKKVNNYSKPLVYFSTHPTNEERIKNAKDAFANKNIKGRNFLVDSVGFSTLKKRAIDETIYLLFEQLEYDASLEMAYLQHLYYPQDEFYLFYITECLRRQSLYVKNFNKAFFITGNYVNLIPDTKEVNKNAVVLSGKTYKKVNEYSYNKSVFLNLKNELYNLSDADLARIKARELITNDTLEFLYNEDALAYFSAKIPEASCVFNIQRMLLSKPWLGDCNYKTENTELENDYVQTITDYKSIENNVSEFTKCPVVLYSLRTYTQYAAGNKVIIEEFNDPILDDNLLKKYYGIAEEYPNDIIDARNKFNFRELQKIRSTTAFLETLGLKGYFGKSVVECDFLSLFPEISHEISKFNYHKLIFLELSTTNVAVSEVPQKKGIFGMTIPEGWGGRAYIVDLANKKIESVLIGGTAFQSIQTTNLMNMFGSNSTPQTREEKNKKKYSTAAWSKQINNVAKKRI